jgi:hypothetical protein
MVQTVSQALHYAQLPSYPKALQKLEGTILDEGGMI